MKKILFYNDAKNNGGHELLAIKLIHHLSINGAYDIYVIISSKNHDFYDRIKGLNNVTIYKINYNSNRFQIIRPLFSWKTLWKLRGIINSVKPQIVLTIQGNIEISNLGLILSVLLKTKVVVYLPMAHYLSEVSKYKVIGKIKDKLLLFYYKLPDNYIVISHMVKSQLEGRGLRIPIEVIYNCIDFDKLSIFDKDETREWYGLNNKKFIVTILGRIEFWHKGHDIFLKFYNKYQSIFENVDFLIVGEGKDKQKLIKLIKNCNNVYYKPHTSNVSYIYSLSDCILMPSRFEGFPLTLIEASYYKLPVIISDLLGVDFLVDKSCIFKIGDIDSIANILNLVIRKKTEGRDIDLSLFSELSFYSNFEKSINALIS